MRNLLRTSNPRLFFSILLTILFYTINQAYAQIKPTANLSGYMNMRYQYGDDISSFDIRRARVDLKGILLEDFDYRLQVDFASSPKILDIYVKWKINKYFGLEAGQFKIPFSIENAYSPLTLETIENAQVISKLSNYDDVAGIKSNGRDIGIMLFGEAIKLDDRNLIKYSIGIFNGSGINTSDKNKDKDISGIVQIFPIEGLSFAGFAYSGKTYIDSNNPYANRCRYGAGIEYKNNSFRIRTEYIKGKTDGKKSEGAYCLGGYKITKSIEALGRIDYFSNDITSSSKIQVFYLGGIDWHINNHFRIQLNYTYKTFRGDACNTGAVAAQLTAML